MRVLLYSPYSLRYGGGGERWILELVKRARTASFEVITTNYVGKREKIDVIKSYPHQGSDFRLTEAPAQVLPPGLMIPSPALVGLLKDRAVQSDCIVFNNVFPGQEVLVAFLKRKSGRPVLSVYQAPLESPAVLTSIYRGILFSRIVRSFDAHHALNRGDYEVLRGMRCKHVFVLPNGVDTSYFRPEISSSRQDKFVVLFVGRLNFHKGFDLVLDISRELLASGPCSFEVWVAGSGPLEPELLQLARHLPGLVVLGQCDQAKLRQVYARAALGLFPSRWEGCPMVGLEAISCGLPVVASDIAGFEGICIKGLNGTTVNLSEGASGFVSAIRSLYETWKDRPEDFRAYQKASRNTALNFDWSKIVPKFEHEVARVCSAAG